MAADSRTMTCELERRHELGEELCFGTELPQRVDEACSSCMLHGVDAWNSTMPLAAVQKHRHSDVAMSLKGELCFGTELPLARG